MFNCHPVRKENFKMKRKVLSLAEKSEIIKSLESGESVTNLSKKYGIAKATVCAIRNRKQKIIKAVTESSGVLKKKNLKLSNMPKMERRLYKWFCLQRVNNVPISNCMVKEKAKTLNQKFQENVNFTASDGWLAKFKRRFGIRSLKISGEKLFAAHQDVDSEDIPLNILQQRFKNSTEGNIMQETIELLEVINPNSTYSTEEIVNWNKDNMDNLSETVEIDDEMEEDEEEEGTNVKISTAEAINSINNVILWAEQKSVSYQNILRLIKIREMAIRILLHESK